MRSFLFVFILISTIKPVFPDSIYVFQDVNNEQYIGDYLYIFSDETDSLGFDQIQHVSGFKKSRKKVPSLGFKKSTVWLKATIKNNSRLDKLVLELANSLIDIAVFYYPQDGEYTVVESGQLKALDERQNKHVNFFIELPIKPGEQKTLYIKIKSIDQIELPVRILSPVQVFETIRFEDFLFGIYLGLMLIMVLYNLFVYFTVKDKSYLYYVIYIVSVLLTQVGFLGYTFYLWPGSPKFESQIIIWASIFVGFASVQFLRIFLNTKNVEPKLDKGFYFAFVLYFIASIITILGYYFAAWIIINFIVTTLSLYMLFVAIKIARKGYRTAKFFIIAWSIFLIGVFIYALKDFGVLPYNYVTKYMMPIGSAIETILLSFALADRIKILQKEKEISQSQALAALQENERIVKEQNVMLEKKVEDRTKELRKSNKELAIAIKDLKDTQSQLVQSEKMASLGQLTAGVAHEINNPINFVSSSIKPLRRDIKDIIAVMEEYESLSKENFEEKIKQISLLKDNIDLPYVKEEIDSLLKGIEEGAIRTSEIVKGLRTFSRVDEADLKRIDIHEGIDSTLILLTSMMHGKIVVEKDYKNNSLIECYAGKLNQVFMNIINNAIHAIMKKKPMEGEGKIWIRTSEEDDFVKISIKDNGTGMPDEVRKKIFDPFFTTKEVGEGTGLGLSIVYNIIDSHKGRIEVFTEEGAGTEFVITLPKFYSNN